MLRPWTRTRLSYLARWLVPLTLALALVCQAANVGEAAAAPRVGGWFLYGANLPWLNWGADFGGGPSGGGVSGNSAQLDAKLQAARAAGMHVVRWWVFEGGSPQIQRDASGTPTGTELERVHRPRRRAGSGRKVRHLLQLRAVRLDQ